MVINLSLKYTNTASKVAKCKSKSNSMLEDSLLNPSASSMIDRWPDDDMGRNSVNPCTIPRIIDSIKFIRTLSCRVLLLLLDSSISFKCHLIKLEITGQSM